MHETIIARMVNTKWPQLTLSFLCVRFAALGGANLQALSSDVRDKGSKQCKCEMKQDVLLIIQD